VAGNTVWSYWQVTSRSSEVNFTKNYTLLYLLSCGQTDWQTQTWMMTMPVPPLYRSAQVIMKWQSLCVVYFATDEAVYSNTIQWIQSMTERKKKTIKKLKNNNNKVMQIMIYPPDRQIPERYHADTVHRSRHQNITPTSWQLINQQTQKRQKHRFISFIV